MSVSIDGEGRRVRLDLNETEATELLHLLREPEKFIEYDHDAGPIRHDWLVFPEIARRLAEGVQRTPRRRLTVVAPLRQIEVELAAAIHALGLEYPARRDAEQIAARLVSQCPTIRVLAEEADSA